MEEITIIIRRATTGKDYIPPVLEGITWDTERKGVPGRLMFTVIKTENLAFHEGDVVMMKYGKKIVFHGFVFQKQRNRDHHIEVTAYDQIRYLKNKTTYCMENVRADQVLSRIAGDWQLDTMNIPNTGYVIEKFEQNNQTALDMITSALELTTTATGKEYYLYDNVGFLTLRDLEAEAKKPDDEWVTIHEESAEDFDYTTSIDTNTYNRVVVIDSEQKSGNPLIIKEDKVNQNKWGVLSNYIEANGLQNPQEFAENVLKYHNRVSRALSITGQFGDIRVQAGSLIYLKLYLGDLNTKENTATWRMLVDKCTHIFNHGHHTMDLTLIGREDFWND